jgi:hypothetical protein
MPGVAKQVSSPVRTNLSFKVAGPTTANCELNSQIQISILRRVFNLHHTYLQLWALWIPDQRRKSEGMQSILEGILGRLQHRKSTVPLFPFALPSALFIPPTLAAFEQTKEPLFCKKRCYIAMPIGKG